MDEEKLVYKVLYLEDEPRLRESVKMLLSFVKDIAVNTDTFATLDAARAAYSAGTYDLVICDGTIEHQTDGGAWAKELYAGGVNVLVWSNDKYEGVPWLDKVASSERLVETVTKLLREGRSTEQPPRTIRRILFVEPNSGKADEAKAFIASLNGSGELPYTVVANIMGNMGEAEIALAIKQVDLIITVNTFAYRYDAVRWAQNVEARLGIPYLIWTWERFEEPSLWIDKMKDLTDFKDMVIAKLN
jgi:hypothetical protein